MTIDFRAFCNCTSLKEISCCYLDKTDTINIIEDDNLPDDFIVVVPDDSYKQIKDMHSLFLQHHIKTSAAYVQDKLRDEIRNFDIHLAACHLMHYKDNGCVQIAIEYLMKKYDLKSADLDMISKAFNVNYALS